MAGPTKSPAQARHAFPVLVKAWVWVCGGGSRGEGGTATKFGEVRSCRTTTRSDSTRTVTGSSRGSALAQSEFRSCSGLRGASARSRPAEALGGLRRAPGAVLRGRHRPPPRYPLLPVSPALPALRQSPPAPLLCLAHPGGAMAAFSKYLTARNSSLAGAALLLLCLLHKRRRALGLHG